MDLLIRAVIRTIHVAIDRRGDHGMIQGRIEFHHIVCIPALHLNLGKLSVPIRASLRLIVIEIILRGFRTQILSRSLHADARDSGRDKDFLILLRIEIETGHIGRTDPTFFLGHDRSRIHMTSHERLRETGLEINMLQGRPALG